MVASDKHPIFWRFTVSELADRTGYSESYLIKLKGGYQPVTPAFQRRMARILGERPSELFKEVAR